MTTLGNLLQVDAPADVTSAVQRGYINQEKINNIPIQRQQDQNALQMDDVNLRQAKLKEAKQKLDMTGELLGSAVDQPSYDAARAKAQQMGLDVSSVPPNFDPNYIRQSQMALMDIKDKIELEMKKTLNDARVATEGAQAGSFGALTNQRNTAADLNRANTQRVMNPPTPSAPVSMNGIAGPTNPVPGVPAPSAMMSGPVPMTANEKRGYDVYTKQQAMKTKAIGSAQAFRAKVDNVTSKIDEILPQIQGMGSLMKGELPTAGFGSGTSSEIAGTKAHDIQKALETVKANFGFNELAEMRANSPTGGALGAVTERELAFLQSVSDNLDQSQSPEQLKKNLINAKRQIIESWNRIKRAYDQQYPEKNTQPSSPNKADKIDTVPQGSVKIGTSGGKDVYQTPDGKHFMAE